MCIFTNEGQIGGIFTDLPMCTETLGRKEGREGLEKRENRNGSECER